MSGRGFLVAGLAAGLVVAVGLSLFCGGTGLAAIDGLFSATPSLDTLILRELRLPRVMLGVLIGAGLGGAGAVMQGFFRNPLADPGVVGVSASAGLGAVTALYFGLASLFALALPLAGVFGATAGVTLLFLIAGRGASATTLILSGVAVNAMAGALTALLMNLAPNPWALAEIAYWLMGSLKDASWTEIAFAAPLILAGLAILSTTGRSLDALSLGEETAVSLGVDLKRQRLTVVAGTALAVGGRHTQRVLASINCGTSDNKSITQRFAGLVHPRTFPVQLRGPHPVRTETHVVPMLDRRPAEIREHLADAPFGHARGR